MNTVNIDNNQALVGLAFQYDETDDLVKTVLQVGSTEEDVELSPLPKEEQTLRDESEAEIHEDLAAVNNVGYRLDLIKKHKLFRSTHHSFEKYCKEVFDISRVHANRKIEAYQTEAILESEPIGSVSIPETESQARELAGLTPDEKKKVCKKVKEAVGDRKATAKDYKRVKNEECQPKSRPTSSEPKAGIVKSKTPVAKAANMPDEKVAGQQSDTSPTLSHQSAGSTAEIITLAELYPTIKILSSAQLSEIAEKAFNIFDHTARRSELEKLLRTLKDQLRLRADLEMKQLAQAQQKEAA